MTTNNPYWQQVQPYLNTAPSMEVFMAREELVLRYAWAIPSPGDLDWIKNLLNGRGVVEIGAGLGYWAWQLTQTGVDVEAYDLMPPGQHDNTYTARPYHPVRQGGPEQAAHHPNRALMLCWPSVEQTWATQTLAHYTGDTLIYIGEPEDGCCADETFWETISQDWNLLDTCPSHVTFPGIHCRLRAYQRR